MPTPTEKEQREDSPEDIARKTIRYRTASEMSGMRVEGIDGSLGKVADILIDDRTWAVRYVVVETRSWLSGRQVLITPRHILDVEENAIRRDSLTVNLDRERIGNAPLLKDGAPISRRYEEEYFLYYKQDAYWFGGSDVWGAGGTPPIPHTPEEQARHDEAMKEIDKCHVRSLEAMQRYEVIASNCEIIGEVSDFLITEGDWIVRWVEVTSSDPFHPLDFCINPGAVKKIDYKAKTITVASPVNFMTTA